MTHENAPMRQQPSCIYCGKPVEGVSGGPGTYMHGACVEARRGAQGETMTTEKAAGLERVTYGEMADAILEWTDNPDHDGALVRIAERLRAVLDQYWTCPRCGGLVPNDHYECAPCAVASGLDVCACGDYRRDHRVDGSCAVCSGRSDPWNGCYEFRLSTKHGA